MTGIQGAYALSETVLADAVRAALASRGVPTSVDAASALAWQLHPGLMEQRAYLGAEQGQLILNEHPDLDIPPVPDYPAPALNKLVRRSAGLTPNPPLARVEVFDPETRSMQQKSVAPWVYPGEEQVLKELARRLTAGLSRHARSASRDLVTATARANRVQWARQLTGAENCGFCAMLASRGAVYGSERRARFTAHDNCDCTATIVRGDDYPGVETAAALRELWTSSTGLAEFTRKYRERRRGKNGLAA